MAILVERALMKFRCTLLTTPVMRFYYGEDLHVLEVKCHSCSELTIVALLELLVTKNHQVRPENENWGLHMFSKSCGPSLPNRSQHDVFLQLEVLLIRIHKCI